MKTIIALVVTLLATTSATALVAQQQQWEDAQKLKPAHLTSHERIAPANEPGTPLTIHGWCSTPQGKPAAGVEVFAYHTDRTGLYSAPHAADPWRLKGWAVTDAEGRFEFRTIRPAPYPNRPIPAHVHVTLSAACCGRQFHELMFRGGSARDERVPRAFRVGRRARHLRDGEPRRRRRRRGELHRPPPYAMTAAHGAPPSVCDRTDARLTAARCRCWRSASPR
jgi:protocatechuate 3,4-dioxygenase beta subunit